jgi:hypothetical protein
MCARLRMRDSNTQPFSQKENAPPIELMRLPTTGFEPARVLDPAVLKTAPLDQLGHVGGEASPGFEPGELESKSSVLTTTL